MFSGARRADDEDEDTESIPDRKPGAFAHRGVGASEEESSEEQTIAVQEEPRNSLLNIPIAAELSRDDGESRRRVDDTVVVHAEPAPEVKTEEESEPTGWLSKKRNKMIALLILLLVVGIIVAIVIPVTGGDSKGSDPEETASSRQAEFTPTPTASPTVSPAPTTIYDRLYGLIAAYSGTDVLEDSESSQSKAFQWTLGDFEVGDWADNTILERYALATIFFATDGFRWLSVTDFMLERSYCSWQGVGCSNETISTLSLPSENLAGTMPREIGLLTTLTSIDFSGNALTGSIPSEIGFLTNLEELDISLGETDTVSSVGSLRRKLEDALSPGFGLTGPLPPEMGGMSSLRVVDLSNNSISGIIPSEFGLLGNIRTLALQNNNLDGEIPIQLGFLGASLQSMSLEKNFLTGAVPNALCSSFSLLQNLSSDCLAEVNGDKPAEVLCKCCNVCCDVNGICRDLDVTAFPSSSPSTSFPSTSPSKSPTATPSSAPSSIPSSIPSVKPSSVPSFVPSMAPSFNPTPTGTPEPTVTASQSPSKGPTLVPSSSPSQRPTSTPTITQSMPPTVSCSIDENSCVGNRACNGAVELCTESGSCSGRNACRGATDLSVAQGSCVGMSMN